MTIVCALAGLIMLVCAASALAAGAAVNIGTPFESGAPSVAVQSNGAAVIAWADTKDLAGASDFVQYCVLPAGASGCEHSGNLMPADAGSHVDDVSVVIDGGTTSIIADVYGTASQGVTKGADYEPDQEWQSTDGGATFPIVNSGKAVAAGNPSGDTQPLGAVVVPGGNQLGYGYDTAAGFTPDNNPQFDAFQESPGIECSFQSCPADEQYAVLEPSTNPDGLGNVPGAFASETGADPGVMGIFMTNFSNGPLGCSSPGNETDFGFAFAYGSGDQGSTNSYDISPGTANSAWRTAITLGDCNVDYPAVDGGPSGFGVLENSEATGHTVYHRFDAANQDFDTPQATVSSTGEQQPSVTQDGFGGVYATYLNGGLGGPVAVSYSYNGGDTWSGPGELDANTDGGVGDLTSSVNSTGQGFAAWDDNGTVYAQSFTSQDSVAPPAADSLATSQTAGLVTGANITAPAGTVGETDRATVSGAAAGHATGTMTYALFSNSTCSHQVFSGGTSTVSGGAARPSAPETSVLAPGKYYWRVVYSGNGGNMFGTVGNQPNSTACGSEILTIVPIGTIGGSGSTNGHELTITGRCVKTPCSGRASVTTLAKAGKASLASVLESKKKGKGKSKVITLASGKFKLSKPGSHKIELRVSGAGRKYLRSRHGRIKVIVTISEQASGLKTTKIRRTIEIKIVKSHKKSKHK